MTALLLVAVPLLASSTLGRVGHRACASLPPSTAVPLLTVAALVTALTTGFVLSVTAFTAAGRLPAVAALGHWSTGVLTAQDNVPVAIGVAATITVAALLVLALGYAANAVLDLVTADAACRRLGPGVDDLVVLDDKRPDAYVVPGLRGRVVVSTAMLQALPAGERRALLAHEHAHLRHRHHLYIQLTELAVRANPLLRQLVDVVRTGVERWADEDAAAVTGDRHTTARAIARAALAQHEALQPRVHRLALGAAGSSAVQRTQALLAPPAPHRTGPAAALIALVTVGPLAAVMSALLTEHYFELAQAALLTRT